MADYEYSKEDIFAVEDLLVRIFGDRVWDDSSAATAQRWIRAMIEFTPHDDLDFKVTTFPTKVNQMIVVGGIEFSSLCAHHLFPFIGKAYVGYLPNALQIGLSKIPRVVHHFATRPCNQEELTSNIAKFLKDRLEAQGVAVVIEGTHTCMSARGVREHDGYMRTSEMRGAFLSNPAAKDEFMTLVGLK